MSVIQCQIIDSSLFSGSSDIFRTANGGYWFEVDVDDSIRTIFNSTSEDSPDFSYFNKVLMSNLHEIVDNEIITPSKRVAVRIVSSNSAIKGDDEWNKIWLGGTWGPRSHNAIYSTDSFQYVYFDHAQPYPQLSASLLTGDYASSVIQISYDYRNYLKEYEDYVTLNPEVSELSLPNYYVMADLSVWDADEVTGALDLYPSQLKNYLSRHNTTNFMLTRFFDRNISKLDPSAGSPGWMWEQEGPLMTKNNNLAIEYLTSSYVQNSLSSSTEKWVASKMKALLFDADAMTVARETEAYAPPAQTRLPYNMKITFPTNDSGEFTTSIAANGLDSKFIKTLYETFSGISTELAIAEQEYNYTADYYSAEELDGQIDSVHDTEAQVYREIDYIQLLINAHNSYKDPGTNEEYMFVGPRTMQRYAAETTSSAYRYINTQGALATLTDVMTYVDENTDETTVTEWSDLYSEVSRHSETVAYRIEKTGGRATGDSNTQKALQNFWFFNSRPTEDAETGATTEFTFYDSQVKYDTDYTYQVYEYVLVGGIRYNFSDLKLSRQIGCEDPLAPERVGLEFYEPTGSNSGERASRLFQGDLSRYPTKFAALSGTFLTDAHVYSQYPYAADFYINYEPVFKIIEIPSYKKKLKILDYLPNAYEVTPYSLDDASNRIGFDLVYAADSESTYPSAVTEADATYKAAYLNANDLNESLTVTDTTVTSPTTIEVYRMTTRPRSVEEFQYYLHDTIDLRIPEQKYNTYGGAIFHDKVAPNMKYYYLFKGINEHGTQSYLTPVYEAQLIDDGGYSYGVFNTIMESELEEKVYTNPTKSFKNLLQLQPNMDQLSLVTTDADFGKSASREIRNISVGSADDLIWDKTFKIRLTSKKTGKKIDFNITYNLRSE
jgi:hypothetical protein